MPSSPNSSRGFLPLVAAHSAKFMLIGLLSLMAGCTSPMSADFQLEAHNGRLEQDAHFDSAYIGINPAGEYDLVIFNNYLRPQRISATNPTLQPVEFPPVEQVVRVHLFWQGVRGPNSGQKLFSNATIDWCVFGRQAPYLGDTLQYEGTAYARISGDAKPGNIVDVSIRDADIHPSIHCGTLSDVLGRASLSGIVHAVRDDARVQEALKTIDDRLAGNPPAPGEVSCP